ncbi:MAG: sigma-70 family RNA polymerase sigma factor [Sphingobacteriales bacterium]|nr:MAG: sigma-70 family RNA polymerase sigma factor [Sphingobacteriales bacterium]
MSNAMLLYAYMSDNELIDKVKAGNKPCFEVLIRRHSQSLYRVGRAYGIAEDDVEDLLQCTHQAGFKRLQRLDKKQPYRLQLLKIMIQNCIDKVQAGVEHTQHNEFEPAARALDAHVLIERMDSTITPAKTLEKHIGHLSQALRTAFVLSEIEGLSIKEVAELQFISESIVKSRLQKAKTEMNKNGNIFHHTEVYPFHRSACDVLVDRVMVGIDADTYQAEKALIPRC